MPAGLVGAVNVACRCILRLAISPSSSSSSLSSSRLKLHLNASFFFLETTPRDSPLSSNKALSGVKGRCVFSSTCSWHSAKGKQKKCTKMSLEKPGTHWPEDVIPNSLRILCR
jgi:hypothetical protein